MQSNILRAPTCLYTNVYWYTPLVYNQLHLIAGTGQKWLETWKINISEARLGYAQIGINCLYWCLINLICWLEWHKNGQKLANDNW